MGRLSSIGLTCGIDKCEFNVEEMEFFGLKFTREGMALTDEKIKARQVINANNWLKHLQLTLPIIIKFATGKNWSLT